jgi:hypothetical protein
MASADRENLMAPEEKMAARVLARHSLTPPYDLMALACIYGDVEIIPFPIVADGVTIGIGGAERPQILVNSLAPEARKNFTLAHELGHIIIPWHTGTIVSHLDADADDYEYLQMESEANKFAAELLIPSLWLKEKHDSYEEFSSYLKYLIKASNASREAVLIKVFKTLQVPIVCCQIDSDGSLIKFYRTATAPNTPSFEGRDLMNDTIFRTEHSFESFKLNGYSYVAWCFNNRDIEESDSRPWREVLEQILLESGTKHLKPSINAILPARFQKCKELSESEICSAIMRTYDGREGIEEAVNHPLFEQYVIKRVKELLSK